MHTYKIEVSLAPSENSTKLKYQWYQWRLIQETSGCVCQQVNFGHGSTPEEAFKAAQAYYTNIILNKI